MHPTFRNNTELGYFWIHEFQDDVQEKTMHLYCEDTLYFEFALLMFRNERIVSYARDALHYALVAHQHYGGFWDFLFSDTHDMEPLFGLDQIDMVVMVLLILETLNHEGFNFPTVCYDLSAARWSQERKTEATRKFLQLASFESLGVCESLLNGTADG